MSLAIGDKVFIDGLVPDRSMFVFALTRRLVYCYTRRLGPVPWAEMDRDRRNGIDVISQMAIAPRRYVRRVEGGRDRYVTWRGHCTLTLLGAP